MGYRWIAAAWFAVCAGVAVGQVPASRPAEGQDHFVGWYELPVRQRESHRPIAGANDLIPVLKHGGQYYTVCRGFEAPLEPVADGLEWAGKPSSMEGTKFTFDPATRAYAITICDRQEANNNDWTMFGEKQQAMRVARPKWLPEESAAAPAGNDDFVGHFAAIYFPGLRFAITKEGDTFAAATHVYEGEQWQENHPMAGAQTTAVPLEGELGLLLHRSLQQQTRIVYHRELKRFEARISGKGQGYLVMPLARTSKEAPPPGLGNGAGRLGIPSWH